MNTLSRAITAQIYPKSDSYAQIRRHWRTLVQSERKHDLTAAHHLLYLAVLGKDWRKAFTPMSNRRKLANGGLANWALFRALRQIHSRWEETGVLAAFDGLVTPPMLQQLRARLPLPQAEAFRAGNFTPSQFPFDAYTLPDAAQDSPHAE